MNLITSTRLLLILIALNLSLSIDVLAKYRDFKRAHNLAVDIYNKHGSISVEEIVMKLMQVKIAISSLKFADIPLNLPTGVDRNLLINTLGLLRIIDISNEKCMQETPEIRTGNNHRLNYIELDGIARNFYPQGKIHDIIKIYSSAQYFICHRGLVVHMASKWVRPMHTQEYLLNFKESILAQFPQDVPVALLTQEQKKNGIWQFMKQYLTLEDEIATDRQVVDTYASFRVDDCFDDITKRFHTLMMTYDMSKRENKNVELYHKGLIRLYDLCKELSEFMKNLAFATYKSSKTKQKSIGPMKSDQSTTPITGYAPSFNKLTTLYYQDNKKELLSESAMRANHFKQLIVNQIKSAPIIVGTEPQAQSATTGISIKAVNIEAGPESHQTASPHEKRDRASGDSSSPTPVPKDERPLG